MYLNMTAFCAGVIILYCSGVLLPWSVYIVSLAVIFLLSALRFFPALFGFAFGCAWAAVAAHLHNDSILPADLEGVALNVQGYPCSLTEQRLTYSQMEFCGLALSDPISGIRLSGERRLLLRWSAAVEIDVYQTQLSLQVKLKRPHGRVNPVGSSYEQYLFQRRIVATGTIVAVQELAAHADLPINHRLRRYIVLLRARFSDALDTQLQGFEHAGLLKALILGDRSGISGRDSRILANTGTQHLIAISGLHVGVIMLVLVRILPRSRLALLVIALAGLVYVVLAGFSTSAQRAWVMCVVGLISLTGYCRPGLRYAFLLAATVVLLLDPLSPLGLGFWFSFLCVALLLMIAWQGFGHGSFWSGFVLIQFVLLVGLAPVNSYFGLPSSLSNGLANLVAIPWVSLVVLPGALLTVLLSLADQHLAQFFYFVLNEVLHVLLGFLDSLQHFAVPLKSESQPVLILSLWLVLPGTLLLFRIRGLSVCLLLSLVLYFSQPSRFENQDSKLVVFDAGQGLAILLQAENDIWLYDTGAAYERSSVAENTILPYLRAQNRSESLTGIIVSHGDWDHAGGIEYLLSVLTADYFWSGETERLHTRYPAEPCLQGMHWYLEAAAIEVLYPSTVLNEVSSNDRSCVLRITINKRVFLLMGDLEGAGEKQFLASYRGDLRADVLIAGHHGSNNATSYALLKRVQPVVVIFSAGYRNRFGHPHPDVIERVKSFNATYYNTALSGAVIFSIASDNTWEVRTARNAASPFWITQ